MVIDATTNQFEFITASHGDAAVIAAIHTESWKENYSSILNKVYLEKEIDYERNVYWSNALKQNDYWQVILAHSYNNVVGFIAAKIDTEPEYDVTVEHLHVLAEFQGHGLGKSLLYRMALICSQHSKSTLCLRVFEENVKAIRFYESMGAVTDHYGIDNFADSQAPDRRMGWTNLRPLLDLE